MPAVLRDPRLALAGLLVLVVALGVRRIDREIHFYDEAVYVASARSLASGAGYRNPGLPGSPPHAKYPPGLSLVLAGVWRLFPAFPDNLLLMKALVLLSAAATVAVAWAWMRTGPPLDALATATLLGLSPFLLVFSTLVTSDVPFGFLSLAAVQLYARRAGTRGLAAALALAALAFLTRTAGLFLFAAIVVHLLLVERRVGQAALAAVVAAATVLPWLAWSRWASAFYAEYPPWVQGNYVGYATAIPSASSLAHLQTIAAVNLRLMVGAWVFFVLPWAAPRIASAAVLAALAALLVVARPRRPSLAAVYCALYLPSIVLIPYPDTGRYALPVIPFLIGWTVAGVRALVRGRVGALALAALVAGAVVIDVRQAVLSRSDRTLFAEFHAMADWIRANVPRDAILVGDWDAGYHLFTGRRAVRVAVNDNLKIYYADAVTTDFPEARELADGFQRLGACWYVHDAMIGGREAVFFDRLLGAIEGVAPPGTVEPVYASRRFAIRRRTDCPADGSGHQAR